MKELIAITFGFIVLTSLSNKGKAESLNGRHKFPVEGYIRREQRLKIVAE